MCVLGSMCLTFFLLRDLFFTCFASFYYLVIHSILFHCIHAFIWISCAPLIILYNLYISRVKLYSFSYPLLIMTKRGRNCDVVSFFKILHVRGRNTCLCKGEMCFILLGGVLTSFFLYLGSYDHVYTHCAYLWYISIYDDVCLLHLPLHVLCLFYLHTHVSYILYAIYYFCFTQRCLDEFCLKCFRNIGCQSLLAINSLLVKFFKSLC